MAQYAYPEAGVGLQDVQWSNFIYAIVGDGVTTSGALVTSANGSGMTVTVGPGEAMVRGVLFGITGSESLSIDAAGSSTRTDSVILRLDRSGTPDVKVVVKKGTSATPPAMTQNANGIWEHRLADVTVAANAVVIAASAVKDRRTALAISPSVGDWSLPIVPVSKGGTGAATAAAARTNLGVAAASHTHDDRYYTEAEVRSLLAGKAASVHGHKATEVSETGVGNVQAAITRLRSDILGKSALGHTHSWGQITGKPSTFPATAHTHDDRYYTKSETDGRVVWGNMTGKPSTFPPSAHNHDQIASGSRRFGIGANGEWWTPDQVHVPNASGSRGGAVTALLDGDGRIVRAASSARYKRDIVRDPELDDVFAVPLARYVLKADEGGQVHYGHIAEDLAANPATRPFVVFNADGQPESFDMLSLLHAQVETLRRRVATLEAAHA